MTKTSCDAGSAASASTSASASAAAVAVAEICIYLQVKFAFFLCCTLCLFIYFFRGFLHSPTHTLIHPHTLLQALTMQLKNLLPAFRLILCHFLLSIVASVAICNTVLSCRAVMPLYFPPPPSLLTCLSQHNTHAFFMLHLDNARCCCCCCCCWAAAAASATSCGVACISMSPFAGFNLCII